MGWEHPGRAPGPVLKPSGSSSPTSPGSSCAGWSLPPPLSVPVGAWHQPLGQRWARDSGGTHCGWAIVAAVPWSPSLLCHGHHHCCATVIITAVPWSLSLLCHDNCLCCAQSLSLLCQGHHHHCVMVITAQCHPFCASHHSHPSDTHPYPLPPSSSSSSLCLGHLPRIHRGSIPISHPCHPPLIPLPGCVWFGTGRAGAGVNPAWKPEPAAGEGPAKANTGKGGCVCCESPRAPRRPPRPTLARTRGWPHAPLARTRWNAPERGQVAARAHRGAPGEPVLTGAAAHGHGGHGGMWRHMGCHGVELCVHDVSHVDGT